MLIIANVSEKDHIINENIQKSGIPFNKSVRVIGADGEQLGMLSLSTALETAYNSGLDLVLVTQGENPVVKIMDYGKFRFDRDKKKKEAKKNQQKVSVKEVQLSCQIDVNDFNYRVNNAKKFLSNGDKVKVIVLFRGRQMAHQDVGKELLEKFVNNLSEYGTVDKAPTMEGRSMSILVVPLKQNSKAQKIKNQTSNE